MYRVTEKCQDGWFKGTSLRTAASGVFPGNYVTPVSRSVSSGRQRKLFTSCRRSYRIISAAFKILAGAKCVPVQEVFLGGGQPWFAPLMGQLWDVDERHLKKVTLARQETKSSVAI